jgi:hypothetical protein
MLQLVGRIEEDLLEAEACNQSAMWRWSECKQGGVHHTSPTPFQY